MLTIPFLVEWLTDFVQAILKALHINVQWDSETLGCWGNNLPTVNDTFVEIQSWLAQPQNADQFLVFMFDDQRDLDTWNKVHLLLEGIQLYFGSRTFTTTDLQKNGGVWPTLRQLRSAGKQSTDVTTKNWSNSC